MDLSMKFEDDCLIVQINGELDMHSAPKFKDRISKTMDKKDLKNLILDFTGVTFIDSSGLGAILGRYRTLQKKGGKVVLVKLKPQTKKIFNLAGLLKIMKEYKDVGSVINDLKKGGSNLG